MSFAHQVRSGDRLLRCGYTTGSCAALAALGASRLLLGLPPEPLSLRTPAGWEVTVEPSSLSCQEGVASCTVQKDGGDDIDITTGLLIGARVRRCPPLPEDEPVRIVGGEGVGRVTKPGLDQPVGEAAINTVPRRMISQACAQACRQAGYAGGLEVTIFVPQGREAAQRTFNPRLGVVGGISILGTSGIVRPQSLAALKDSIGVEIRQNAALGHKTLLLAPGNYGADFIKAHLPQPRPPLVLCSNFIGDALDAAALYGFEQVLLAGHVGKLVKLAGGIMDTHSRTADCRAELFAAHAALAGADQAVTAALMGAATCDACLDILEKEGLCQAVLASLLDKIEFHLCARAAGRFQAGAWLFSLQRGSLGLTPTGQKLLQRIQTL